MDKKPLIGVSICAVVLLVLGSLTNVVGIESSQGCGCGDPPCWSELSGTMGGQQLVCERCCGDVQWYSQLYLLSN